MTLIRGEVGVRDWMTIEKFCEEGLDLREGVEPGEDGFAFFIILEAAVDLFADVVGEPSDFASSSHRFSVFRCFNISMTRVSTLYGVTNPVTEVTKLVTHEESLTFAFVKRTMENGDGTADDGLASDVSLPMWNVEARYIDRKIDRTNLELALKLSLLAASLLYTLLRIVAELQKMRANSRKNGS